MVGILFWRLLTSLYHVNFSPAARGEPVSRRVSRDVGSDFGSPPSGFFQPRGENRFAGGSIETFAATLVRLQAEREGLDFVVASFKNFTR